LQRHLQSFVDFRNSTLSDFGYDFVLTDARCGLVGDILYRHSIFLTKRQKRNSLRLFLFIKSDAVW
jgi:hypothetical protein